MNGLCILLLWILLTVPATPSAWARGGGGCVEEGSLVLTPNGPVPVERLQAGDVILSWFGGALRPASVQARTEVQPEEFVELAVSGSVVRATEEHPFATAPGEFREAGRLRPGDTLYVRDGAGLKPEAVQSATRVGSSRPAYNLTVFPGGTFFSSGILVHNKGGGCFLPGTPILRSDGTETPIEEIRPGEEVLAFTSRGETVRTIVEEVLVHDVNEYFTVSTERVVLRVTPEHPFFIGNGTYRTVDALRLNDSIFVYDGKGLRQERIAGIERNREGTLVYNLRTDSPHTFFAGGAAVHNKGGGCFAAGVKVETPHGPVPIESLAPGERVLAVGDGGAATEATVEGVYAARSNLLEIRTETGTLTTTPEHPLQLSGGGFRQAGEIAAGEGITVFHNGKTGTAKIIDSFTRKGEAQVFNLRVTEPHTFLANGFVVHNKGGGYSGYHSSSSSRASSTKSGNATSQDLGSLGIIDEKTRWKDDWPLWKIVSLGGGAFLPFAILIFIAVRVLGKKKNLDVIIGRSRIAPKAEKTLKLLESIAEYDMSMLLENLRGVAESTFRQLQTCWETRVYSPMEHLLMPDLYAQHCAQIQGMIRNHEINFISDLAVESVDIVHVRYTNNPDQREFTALITAAARDYYQDDRTGKFLRGDKKPERFQEFWTFQYQGSAWRLREIDQAGESDALKDANFCETVAGPQFEDSAGGAGAEKEAGGTRIDRLLNSLAKTDPLWRREYLKARVRIIFTNVFMAREIGETTAVKAENFFPEVASYLRDEISRTRENGIAVEYRNFCVRQIGIALVRNSPDPTRDEFTARISAHAQKIVKRNGEQIQADEYVVSFEECWTFGRLDGDWRLKEMG